MERRIHFRRVEWIGAVENLTALIGATLAVRPNVDDATFERAGQTFEVTNRDLARPNEVRLHIDLFVPGARKPISRRARGVPRADLGEASPPQGAEFADTELAAVVRSNMMAFAATGLHGESRMNHALRGLVALQHGDDVANRMALTAHADAAMMARLLDEGIDTLDLGLDLPAADAAHLVAEQPLDWRASLGRAVGQEIMNRVTQDNEGPAIELLNQLNARLRLKLRKRQPTVEQVASLTALAEDAVGDDQQFRIRTITSKTTFTRDKLLLSSTFQQAAGTRLDYQAAWDAASAFLDTQV